MRLKVTKDGERYYAYYLLLIILNRTITVQK